MSTRLLYLTRRFDMCEWAARVVSCRSNSSDGTSSSNTKKVYPHTVVLDETIFHPQGGGQPADQGTIASPSGGSFRVEHVSKDPAGFVEHHGHFVSQGTFVEGERVDLVVDFERRRLNTRLHSAGHMLDFALHCHAGVPFAALTGSRGYHFPDGPWIELVFDGAYDGIDAVLGEPMALQSKLQAAVDELIAKDVPFESLEMPVMDVPELQRRFINSAVLAAPSTALVRVMRLQGHEELLQPCGGTQVPCTGLIGRIRVGKVSIKRKADNTIVVKINYDLA